MLVLILVLTLLFLRESKSQRQMNHSFLSSMGATGREQTGTLLQTVMKLAEEQTKQLQMQSVLVDKAMALVGTADPIAFQQVQAMGTPSGYDDGVSFDPSEEAELDRIAARNPNLGEQGDDVNGIEESFLADIGIDPAQFQSYPVGYPDQPPAE